jgi:hypothetical protein
MRTTRILLAVGFVSGIALGTLASAPRATAQYYPPPPGYGYGYGYHHRTWNGCPPGWTVQGGNCAPYKGPGVEAGTPGMGAHPVTRYRVETAHRTEVTESALTAADAATYSVTRTDQGSGEAARRGHSLLLVLRRC